MASVSIDGEHLVKLYPHLFKNDPALGGQSMEQVRNLKLYNLAQQFVNEYLENGEDYALCWLVGKADAEEIVELREYVAYAFDKSGYQIKKVG